MDPVKAANIHPFPKEDVEFSDDDSSLAEVVSEEIGQTAMTDTVTPKHKHNRVCRTGYDVLYGKARLKFNHN